MCVWALCKQVLQSDGGNYSACVNGATLALIDAGIGMRDVVCACTAAVLGTDSATTIVDVNNMEESTPRGAVVTVAILPKSGQIVHVDMSGRLHEVKLPALLDTATAGCGDVMHRLEDVIQCHVKQLASTVANR